MIDITTVVGFILAGAVMYFGVVMDTELSLLINGPAFIIVLGGTLVAMMINTPVRMLPNLVMAFAKLFVEPKLGTMESAIKKVVLYSEQAIKSGVESFTDLEEFKNEIPFLRNGLVMLMDGRTDMFIKDVMESHIKETASRHKLISDSFVIMGTFSPTFGLLGTVIGIIQVLKNVTDPQMVGKHMAVALLTVFYGILLANFVFLPLSGKLRFRSSMETKYKQLLVEGVLCIQKGYLPIMVEQRLNAFLQEGKTA